MRRTPYEDLRLGILELWQAEQGPAVLAPVLAQFLRRLERVLATAAPEQFRTLPSLETFSSFKNTLGRESVSLSLSLSFSLGRLS